MPILCNRKFWLDGSTTEGQGITKNINCIRHMGTMNIDRKFNVNLTLSFGYQFIFIQLM